MSRILVCAIDSDGLLDMTDVDPSCFGSSGSAHALEDLHGSRDVDVLAEQLHLYFADHLVAELDGELLLARIECAQQALDVEQTQTAGILPPPARG